MVELTVLFAQGGALYLNGASGAVTLNAVTFSGNSASSPTSSAYGGALYINFKAATLINVSFLSNSAVRLFTLGHDGFGVHLIVCSLFFFLILCPAFATID